MGKDQMPVDPGIGLGRKLVDNHLPCGQHDLPVGAVDHVAIHIHVVKIIVKPDSLNLPVGLQQRAFIPDPDVLDGNIMAPDFLGAQLFLDLKIDFFDVVQTVGLAGKLNIVGNKRGFLGQFIGFDHNLLNQDRKTAGQDQNGCHPHPAADQEQFHLQPKRTVNQKNAPQ